MCRAPSLLTCLMLTFTAADARSLEPIDEPPMAPTPAPDAPLEPAPEPPPARDSSSEEAPSDDPSSEEAPPRPERPGPFPQGKVRLGVGGGLLSSRDAVAFGLEIGFGYFVIDNVEVGLDSAFQFGESPFAAYLAPTVRVLFPINPSVAPYLGGFYRHWFLTGAFEDFDTLGARAGIVVRTGAVFFGIGLVYEAVVSTCSGDCTDLYPELGASVVF